MQLEDAKILLGSCRREEIVDAEHHDVEVSWRDAEDKIVGSGFFSSKKSVVEIGHGLDVFEAVATFRSEEARELRFLGKKVAIAKEPLHGIAPDLLVCVMSADVTCGVVRLLPTWLGPPAPAMLILSEESHLDFDDAPDA